MKRQFNTCLIVSLLSLCLIVAGANAGTNYGRFGATVPSATGQAYLPNNSPSNSAGVYVPAEEISMPTGNSAGAYLPGEEINMPTWDPTGICLPNEAGTVSPWNIIGACPPNGLGTAPQSNIHDLQLNDGSNSGEQMVAPGQPSRGLIRKADPVPNKRGQTGTLDGFWNDLTRMLGQ